jgi:hypothetical protein
VGASVAKPSRAASRNRGARAALCALVGGLVSGGLALESAGCGGGGDSNAGASDGAADGHFGDDTGSAVDSPSNDGQAAGHDASMSAGDASGMGHDGAMSMPDASTPPHDGPTSSPDASANADAPRSDSTAPADASEGGARADASTSDACVATGGGSYTTTFPLTEDPISEGCRWLNGFTLGIDWGNVQTTPGLAFGTVVSGGPPYSDSTAVLSGTWPADQSAQATVHIGTPKSSIYEEVELRLRVSITPHSITGYEFNFRATSDGSQYAQIVRWNGAINDFTMLNGVTGPGLHDGSVVKATAVGNTLTAYIDGVMQVQATDSTFSTGRPGVGFYNQGGTTSDNSNYGFSTFTTPAP